jgi:zinc protease
MRMRNTLILALLLSGCASGPSSISGVRGMERRVLPNGLAVVVKEDHRLPTVTALVAYRVGSALEDEKEGLTGVSHFFEHMVFKGTEKYKRGDIDLITMRCGGENNAFTDFDMTGYWFHVHSSHLDDVLDILADTMGNCTLDPKEFELERGPVLQEMNIWLDGSWGALEREIGKTMYRASGYRHPVLGYVDDVKNLTREQMMAYYKAHYCPQNASLIVVGDVDREDIYRRAEKFFGKIPRGPRADPPPPFEGPQEEERTVEIRTDKTTDRIILGFRGDKAGSDDDVTLDVAATILGEGRTSRLHARLVEKEGLAGEGNVNVSNESRKREGYFSVQVELAIGAPLDEVRRILLEELLELRKAPVTEKELRRAKNILRAHWVFETESQYALAQKIGYFEGFDLPEYVGTYLDRVESVTARDVLACAKKYFTPENRTVGIGRAAPKAEEEKKEPEKKDPDKKDPDKKDGGKPGGEKKEGDKRRPGQRSPGLQAKSGPPDLGPVREVKLENGLTVLIKSRRDFPILAIQGFVNGGMLFEPEDKAGLATLVGDTLDEGIKDDRGRERTGDELAEEIESLGGKFSTNSNGVSVKVLSEHATQAFDLLRDILRYPSFPEERVKKVREDMLAEIESRDDDSAARARRLFFEEAFRGHPFHRPPQGYEETVKALVRKDCVDYYRRFFRPENAIVSIAGDIDPDRAAEEVRKRFATWKGEGAWSPPRVPQIARQQEPRTVYAHAPTSQVRFQMGHVGIDRSNPDFFTLRVMETILCTSPGFTNRMAKNVRDLQGLAYDVGGSITSGAGQAPGPFTIVLGVEAKDKDKALATVRAELEKFLKDGPTAQEVDDAKNYLLDSFVGSWETVEDVASYMLEVKRYDLGKDYAAQFHRAVSRVTAESVLRAARQYIDLGKMTLVGVGPVDKDGKLQLEGDKDK